MDSVSIDRTAPDVTYDGPNGGSVPITGARLQVTVTDTGAGPQITGSHVWLKDTTHNTDEVEVNASRCNLPGDRWDENGISCSLNGYLIPNSQYQVRIVWLDHVGNLAQPNVWGFRTGV